MTKKKRISNSFSEHEVNYLTKLLDAVRNPHSAWGDIQPFTKQPELTSIYRKVLGMKKKMEGPQ
jgi:hypothetical protein